MKIFYGCNPVNGMLSGALKCVELRISPLMFELPTARLGDKASEVFVKSKLPVDKLSQIWSVALRQHV